jgi:hypothetical protein
MIATYTDFVLVHKLISEETSSGDIATVDNKILDTPIRRSLYGILKNKKKCKCKKLKSL